MTLPDEIMLTHAEAAKIARCSENTLHSWEPPCRSRKGRCWLYPREEFLAWLKSTPNEGVIDRPQAKPQNRRSIYRRIGKKWQGK